MERLQPHYHPYGGSHLKKAKTPFATLTKNSMATNEEWWEYFYELQEMLKKIQESDLPDDLKEKLTDSYLEKLSIVKKFFLE